MKRKLKLGRLITVIAIIGAISSVAYLEAGRFLAKHNINGKSEADRTLIVRTMEDYEKDMLCNLIEAEAKLRDLTKEDKIGLVNVIFNNCEQYDLKVEDVITGTLDFQSVKDLSILKSKATNDTIAIVDTVILGLNNIGTATSFNYQDGSQEYPTFMKEIYSYGKLVFFQ